MRWPSEDVELWHPDSPGVRMTVRVLWPRNVWLRRVVARRPDYDPRFPIDFATTGEVLRKYRDRRQPGSTWRDRAVCRLAGHRPVRHITEMRLIGQPVIGPLGYEVLVWYYQCSRCHQRFGKTPPATRRRPRHVLEDVVLDIKERFHRP